MFHRIDIVIYLYCNISNVLRGILTRKCKHGIGGQQAIINKETEGK